MAMGGDDANLGIDSEIGVDAEIKSGLKIPPLIWIMIPMFSITKNYVGMYLDFISRSMSLKLLQNYVNWYYPTYTNSIQQSSVMKKKYKQNNRKNIYNLLQTGFETNEEEYALRDFIFQCNILRIHM